VREHADLQILSTHHMRALTCAAAILLAGAPPPLAAQSPQPDSVATRVIGIGRSAVGTLGKPDAFSADSTHVQSWTLSGQAGQTVTIDLASTEFDAYLMLRGPGIRGSRDYSDDDSGGACNARLTITFPQNGEFDIIVNTAGKRETGAFTLTVEAGSKPKSLTRCNRDR
jgi:hypothetical protein